MNSKEKKNYKYRYLNEIAVLFLAVYSSFGLSLFASVSTQDSKITLVEEGLGNLVRQLWSTNGLLLPLKLVVLSIFFGALYKIIFNNYKNIGTFLFKYRYFVAICALLLCTILELSGSSIALWTNWIGQTENADGLLWGIPRIIRGDDYAVWTPIALSQYYNKPEAFGYFSDTVRGMSTDVSIVYGVPSFSLITIFRPMYWGYLFLSPEKGLAFMWAFRQIALFLGAFELAMIYTKENKWLSCAAAVLTAYSPLVQWWFNTSQQADVITFGQIIVVLFYYYFIKTKVWQKVLLAMGLYIFLGGYITIFYPAGQIPVVYVAFVMGIALLLVDRKKICFKKNIDIPIIVSTVVVMGVSLAYIAYLSWDTIMAVLNSSYPGKRVSTGGGAFPMLFRYPTTIWETMDGSDNPFLVGTNLSFYDFFPLGIVMGVYALIKEKKKDLLTALLLVVQGFFLVYLIFGVPGFVAKITLLSYSTTSAIIWAIGSLNIFLLFRSISVLGRIEIKKGLLLSIGITILVTILNVGYYKAFYENVFIIISIVILFLGASFGILSVGIQNEFQKTFLILCISVSLAAGFLVNPVQKGIEEIFNNDLVSSIKDIADNDRGLWLVEGAYPATNIPLLGGAPTINSTNVYPALERWKSIDVTGEFEEIYNRYAHINAELVDEETSFDLVAPDSFKINLNYEDLEKLEVSYILTTKTYEETCRGISFKLLDSLNGFNIYQLNY